MDSFSIDIKLKKKNTIKKHRRLQKIASLFRFVEICLVLAFVSRFSIRLPVAVKNSSEYFKDLSVLLVSPRFVFIIGNAIVITLFAKSGQFSGQDSTIKKSTADLYEEFVEKSEKIQGMHRYEAEHKRKQSSSGQHIAKNREKQSSYVQCTIKKEESCGKIYERSKSEKSERTNRNKSSRELRRTVTEKCRGSVACSEGWVKISYPEDQMSNEEFRCTVEAFIERQKRFRSVEENYWIE